MLMHGNNMFDRYYCINGSKKSILERYFALFCFDFFTSAHEDGFH